MGKSWGAPVLALLLGAAGGWIHNARSWEDRARSETAGARTAEKRDRRLASSNVLLAQQSPAPSPPEGVPGRAPGDFRKRLLEHRDLLIAPAQVLALDKARRKKELHDHLDTAPLLDQAKKQLNDLARKGWKEFQKDVAAERA